MEMSNPKEDDICIECVLITASNSDISKVNDDDRISQDSVSTYFEHSSICNNNVINKSTNNVTKTVNEGDLCDDCLIIEHKDAFNKNLLKNEFGSGEDVHKCTFVCSRRNARGTQYVMECSDENCPKFKFWTIVDSGGNGWSVEQTPIGSDPLPQEVQGGRSCFVTSYGLCSKEQLIDLIGSGLSARIMDEVRPQVEVSEWYAGRWDCSCIYLLKVYLLDENMQTVQVIGGQRKVSQGKGSKWHRVMYKFRDYDPGVRYVLFSHGGKDTQFWDGHFGSKMAGGSVVVKIPNTRLQQHIHSE